MIARAALFSTLVACSFSAPVAAQWQPATHLTVSTVSHGVKLTLTVPRRNYPRNALIRVSVRLENVSQHWKTISGGGPMCGSNHPGAAVTTDAGLAVYPPAIPSVFASCGRFLRGTRLPPGGVLHAHPLIILRGNHVMAYARIDNQGTELVTRQLVLHLVPGVAPQVTFTKTFFLQAAVRPANAGMKKRLYFLYGYRCPGGGDPADHGIISTSSGVVTWQSTTLSHHGAYLFQVGCRDPIEWHVVAGYLNQPVAMIDYPAPS